MHSALPGDMPGKTGSSVGAMLPFPGTSVPTTCCHSPFDDQFENVAIECTESNISSAPWGKESTKAEGAVRCGSKPIDAHRVTVSSFGSFSVLSSYCASIN